MEEIGFIEDLWRKNRRHVYPLRTNPFKHQGPLTYNPHIPTYSL